jgi:hypothetical protein
VWDLTQRRLVATSTFVGIRSSLPKVPAAARLYHATWTRSIVLRRLQTVLPLDYSSTAPGRIRQRHLEVGRRLRSRRSRGCRRLTMLILLLSERLNRLISTGGSKYHQSRYQMVEPPSHVHGSLPVLSPPVMNIVSRARSARLGRRGVDDYQPLWLSLVLGRAEEPRAR